MAKNEDGEVIVSESVFDGLEDVRDSGETNMFDVSAVIAIAEANGYYDTAIWIASNKAEYTAGIFSGFATEDEDESD